MVHHRSLKQRVISFLHASAHRPPMGVYAIGDQVSWSGADGVVVSVTASQLQVIFPKTGEGVAPIIVKFDTHGQFFPLGIAHALLFISRPVSSQEALPNVQVPAETSEPTADVL